MKRFIKPTLIIALSNIMAYAIYLLLLIMGIVHYYELEGVEYETNLSVYITFFIASTVTTFLFSLLFRLDKTGLFILIAEIILLDVPSLNFMGALQICNYIAFKFSTINYSVICFASFALSTLILIISATTAQKINKRLLRHLYFGSTDIDY